MSDKPGGSGGNNGSAAVRITDLFNWLLTWVQPDGAIFGFHNHSVWGGNPYRWGDFTSGHSTWASPLIPAVARLLSLFPDTDGRKLLHRLVTFQTATFQDNGNYRHIGFQVGESLDFGLIHNAITNVSLCTAAAYYAPELGEALMRQIHDAFLRNTPCHGRPTSGATCNQDYARIWAKLLFTMAFGDRRFYDQLPADLDFMIDNFHVRGVPDALSAATLRSLGDRNTVEPAEYYGLMISPLVLAARIYGEHRYLDEALAIARHVARSAWTDAAGCTRFHRLWYRTADGPWQSNREPMLIAGMGDTLAGIREVTAQVADAELTAFADACDATYAHYQHPRGFFAAASGWQSEVDVVPSTAWHAHDLRYLVSRPGATTGFLWHEAFAPDPRTAVLLGDQCFWVERDRHWAIADYFWQDVFDLHGRKDRDRFGRDMRWIGGPRALPEDTRFPHLPVFVKSDGRIRHVPAHDAQADESPLSVMVHAAAVLDEHE